ncbi:hypothetical protein J7L60_06545 [Candidatus Bathyarchaeota archaeon]|nr:hypothetical protein [Candidatus Bathyarchaeota archaeon]
MTSTARPYSRELLSVGTSTLARVPLIGALNPMRDAAFRTELRMTEERGGLSLYSMR